MLFTVIPFLLAAQIDVRENELGIKEKWINGAEVIYDVRVVSVKYPFETVTYPSEDTEVQMPWNLTMKLACRQKSHSTLNCREYYPESRINETRKPKKNEKQQRENCSDIKFELNFDRYGLTSIVLPSSLHVVTVDVIKSIVAHMSIDANIYNFRTKNFEAWENFTTGTCKTNYSGTSLRNVHDDGADTTMKKSYEIFLSPSMRSMKNGRLEIHRRRNLNECLRRIDYLFGSHKGLIPSYLDVKVNSSESHMIIGEQEFTSWTENTVFLSNKFNNSGHKLIEKITLSLNDIVPASGPLPPFDTITFTANIFPGGSNVDDYEEESSSEEESYSEEINDSEENNDLS